MPSSTALRDNSIEAAPSVQHIGDFPEAGACPGKTLSCLSAVSPSADAKNAAVAVEHPEESNPTADRVATDGQPDTT
jgi:hypothetical protein